MDEKKQVNIDDLIIWTDNPRHGLHDSKDQYLETDVINILIDVVGQDKMYNLAKDICQFQGLMGNILPVVVNNDNQFCVYDGNRRISAFKFLRNPTIISNSELRNKIVNLVNGKDLSFLDKVDVLVTSKENALTLMDKMHTGEQNGVGILPWDSYVRDISLVSRGRNPFYPHAFRIAKLLEIKKKKDFIIPYTNLNRLFGSTYLKEIFEIKELSEIYQVQIKEAISELIKYKTYRKFTSFSREFNIMDTGEEKDSDKPIRRFCEWYLERKKSKNKFCIKISPVEIYCDREYSFDLHDLRILDVNNNEVKYTFDDLYIQYVDPSAKKRDCIDCKVLGEWKIQVSYKGNESESIVKVVDLAKPDVVFDEKAFTVQFGNSIALPDLVVRALNSHREDMASTLQVSALDGALINNLVFTQKNSVGEYALSFQFNNEGKLYAIRKTIKVIDPIQPMYGVINDARPFVFTGGMRITFSDYVARLINEINNIWGLNYSNMICCSVRSVVELSLDALREKGIISPESDNLEVRLNEFKNYLSKRGVEQICRKFPEIFRFKNEKNFIENLDIDSLKAILHLGAHKGAARVDMSILLEKCQKQISVLLAYIETLIGT